MERTQKVNGRTDRQTGGRTEARHNTTRLRRTYKNFFVIDKIYDNRSKFNAMRTEVKPVYSLDIVCGV